MHGPPPLHTMTINPLPVVLSPDFISGKPFHRGRSSAAPGRRVAEPHRASVRQIVIHLLLGKSFISPIYVSADVVPMETTRADHACAPGLKLSVGRGLCKDPSHQ